MVKQSIAALLLALLLCQPAHAFSLRKVVGAPFWCVGFAVCVVADLTVVPLCKGVTHYIDAPAIKGW